MRQFLEKITLYAAVKCVSSNYKDGQQCKRVYNSMIYILFVKAHALFCALDYMSHLRDFNCTQVKLANSSLCYRCVGGFQESHFPCLKKSIFTYLPLHFIVPLLFIRSVSLHYISATTLRIMMNKELSLVCFSIIFYNFYGIYYFNSLKPYNKT